jgi:dihydrofolate reductase
MRKIILSPLITLDGVVEAPGGEPNFKYTGWSGEYFDDEYLHFSLKQTMDAEALLIGRHTYEGFAASWPNIQDKEGFGDKMNSMQKYVVSTTLQNPTWNNTTVISKNVVDEIRKLKSESGGDLLVNGSGTLAQTLLQHDLVDEYRFMLHPTILGIGNGLYRNVGERKKLKLADTKVFRSGIVVLIYHPEV